MDCGRAIDLIECPVRPPAPHPFLEWDGPIAFAHRGGRVTTREHDAGVPACGRPRLHLPRDGCPRHQRRGARRLPRRRPVAHMRAAGTDRHAPGARCRPRESPAGNRSHCSRTSSAPSPTLASTSTARPNSALPSLIASLRRLDCLDRVCLGGFSDQRLRRLRAAFGERLCSSFGPVQMARPSQRGAWCRSAGSWHRFGQGRPGHDRHAGHRRPRPPPRLPRPRLDDRRSRDDAPARPRRRRHHDRSSAGAEGRAARPRRWR